MQDLLRNRKQCVKSGLCCEVNKCKNMHTKKDNDAKEVPQYSKKSLRDESSNHALSEIDIHINNNMNNSCVGKL